MPIVMFWVVTPCGLVGAYQRFLHLIYGLTFGCVGKMNTLLPELQP
jgi:hypothetical protein